MSQATSSHACAALEIRDLTVRYRQRAVLHGLTLPALQPGRVLALVGPNGAGKSTLLRALAGLIPATGLAALGKHELLTLLPSTRAEMVSFMPQHVPPGTTMTVLEATLVATHGLHMHQPLEQSLQVLQQLGIAHLAMQALSSLSGGQRQMAALAQAVVRNCPVLLLDEPVSALDLAHQWQVLHSVQSLARAGRIVCMVLHDLTLAAQWADDIALLQGGQLLAFGPPQLAITPELLRTAYGVHSRVRHCEQGRIYVMVDGLATPPSSLSPTPLAQQELR